ncbi:MAG: hypothetical protein NTY95_16820 [Bacteroidia bacterium]|nr:hypothetical protein [Bacteroidia bacterium]
MNRRTIRYSVIVIPILILVIFLFRERSPFGGGNTSFAAEPKIEITRIEFSEGKNTLTLEKAGEEWLVNKDLKTRKTGILFILKILTEMEIKSPVTPELFNKEIIENRIDPVRVKVFEKSKIIKSFLVYKTASNKYGNIMKLRESSKPFIVFVPGNEVEIGSGFTMNELFWQPYTVFNLLPSDIYSVALENMADTSSSFMIKNENQRFRLYGNPGELTGWDTSRLIRYVSYFAHVPFESWALNLSDNEKKNIEKEEPVYKITVVTSEGERKIVKLWQRSVNGNDVTKLDTDRLWAKTEGSAEIFVIRYIDIDPLLKKRSYFYPG